MRTILLSLFVLLTTAAQMPSFAQKPTKIQALIITGQNYNIHDWRGTTAVLRQILEDSGRFEVRVTEEFRGAGPETLAPYDLVIQNYFDVKPNLRWGERAENALLDYVRSGKGIVLFHWAVGAFDGWAEYEKMCGANWRTNNGDHSVRHDFTVDIKDPEHPITRGMKASFFQSNDELYANLKWQPEGSYHVLATAWDDPAFPPYLKGKPRPAPGLHQPMLWTVQYGKGRVFTTALGHDTNAMKSIGFISTLARGAEWAATGKVTIPLPLELAK